MSTFNPPVKCTYLWAGGGTPISGWLWGFSPGDTSNPDSAIVQPLKGGPLKMVRIESVSPIVLESFWRGYE